MKRNDLIEPCQIAECDGDGLAVVREGPLQGTRVCIEHLIEHGIDEGWWSSVTR